MTFVDYFSDDMQPTKPFVPREEAGERTEVHASELFGFVYSVGLVDPEKNYLALVREDGKIFWVLEEGGRLVVHTLQ